MYCGRTGPIGRVVLPGAVCAEGKGRTIESGRAGWQAVVLSREKGAVHVERE